MLLYYFCDISVAMEVVSDVYLLQRTSIFSVQEAAKLGQHFWKLKQAYYLKLRNFGNDCIKQYLERLFDVALERLDFCHV